MSKLFFLLLLCVNNALAQGDRIESLKHELESTQDKATKAFFASQLADAYAETKPDSSFYYAEQAVQFAQQMKLKLPEADALIFKAYALLNMGNFSLALKASLFAVTIVEDPNAEKSDLPPKYLHLPGLNKPVTPHILRLHLLGRAYMYTGLVYGNANNNEKEVDQYRKAGKIFQTIGDTFELADNFMLLGRVYRTLKKMDSAIFYEQKAHELSLKTGYLKHLGSILLNLARIHFAKGNKERAIEYFKKAITASYEQNYLRGVVAANLGLADIFQQSNRSDSVFHYLQTAFQIADELNAPDLLLRCYAALAEYYKNSGTKDSIIKYQELVIKMNDSLFSSKQGQQFQNIDFEEQQRRRAVEEANLVFQSRLRLYGLLVALSVFSLIAIILWRNNRQRKKANLLLRRQNEELESTLRKLNATQNQLIQSEKMASLGELTAGIAHEIQNPLNFVNNFSEVNKELLIEMNAEIEKGNADEVKAIAKDIIDNEQKINHHGKRAAAIVKGMLQHSRSSNGVKEPTNINTLADEYFRLAYHGLRAKDKSFNATMKTDYDESIDNINIIPQDVGRVILNLITNAFYAVTEKKKQQQDNYDPTVSVITKKSGDKVLISVKDNGNGIPEKVLDKIFQPFFTTKPTGQGTGLGLSLSYDIITKGHGGELKMKTKEGEFAEFIISLPY
jgi:signal transduction histidine kinase